MKCDKCGQSGAREFYSSRLGRRVAFCGRCPVTYQSINLGDASVCGEYIYWRTPSWRWCCFECRGFEGYDAEEATRHAWYVHGVVERAGIVLNRSGVIRAPARPRVVLR